MRVLPIETEHRILFSFHALPIRIKSDCYFFSLNPEYLLDFILIDLSTFCFELSLFDISDLNN